ncbi:MAG: hypothetical protein R3296_12610 [Oleiphilaceae bacterium]|nr:hypothetical protein [Oleiphilaceae bacterium]
MKRFYSLFVLLLFWAPISLATPYGEWGLMGGEKGEGIPMNEAQPGMVMPQSRDVGIPSYPDAKVLVVVPLGDGSCSLGLRTFATIESVCDFYESKLKPSDGYTLRAREEMSCGYTTEDKNYVGVSVSHSPDPLFASNNGETMVSMVFYPKNDYMCTVDLYN